MVALGLAAGLLGACAVGGGPVEDEAGPLPEEFAEPSRPLAGPLADSSGGEAGPDKAVATTQAGGPVPADAGTGPGAGPGPAGTVPPGRGTGAPPAPPPTVPSYRVVLDLTDPTGDAGLQARSYGDLVRLRIEDDGTRARVTVQMGGDVPAQPAEGEVMAVGVDVHRGADEYQLFALGNADGWRAGLQIGTEWVDYPGTFELGGTVLVFTVPWSSLGGRRAGTVSVFADWSQQQVAVVADASEDRAPGRGTQPFSFPST